MYKNEAYFMLKKQFPSRQSALSEIINLQAIQNLPKGTEHFLSDLHGNSETFLHILRNASGVIRTKIDLSLCDTLNERQKNELAALIYYPTEVLADMRKKGKTKAYYAKTLKNLIEVCRLTAAKYTRSKVRKALPKDYAYIIDELINIPTHSINKEAYYDSIIRSILELNDEENFITETCHLIQRLAVDHLHIVGDIYDRGCGGDAIVDYLRAYHSLDIEWGNHDALWMGAYFGNLACICNLLRINCTYRTLQVIENYGINLRPLAVFADETYANDDLSAFAISEVYGKETDFETDAMLARMTKAVTVMQLKLENRLILAHPEFGMRDRVRYPSCDLTEQESKLLDVLRAEFTSSARLKKHMEFLLAKGSMYRVCNGNLLMHGSVPTEPDGSFSVVTVKGEAFSGKALYDRLDALVRAAHEGDAYSVDYMWYLWCGRKSPLFGRDRMCVYEKYFTDESCDEAKDPYYTFVEQEEYCHAVLRAFGTDKPNSVIVNGHMPVDVRHGERADSGGGRHITIDGGFSRAYHEKTGIGGFTLIHNSQGLFLAQHQPFSSAENVIRYADDLQSKVIPLRLYDKRVLVKDTDTGKSLARQIRILKEMIKSAYNE